MSPHDLKELVKKHNIKMLDVKFVDFLGQWKHLTFPIERLEVPPVPTYSYACQNCGHAFDIRQSFTDDALTVCPECGEPRLRKVIHPVGIAFKGSGFYKTDSRSSSTSSSKPAASSSADGGAKKDGAAASSGPSASSSTTSSSATSASASSSSGGSSTAS